MSQPQVLEIRNPNNLIIVTKALLKQHPDWVEQLAPFYDLRADASLDPVFSNQVKIAGRVIDPIKFVPVEGIGDVVADGRQRTRAAVANGFPSVPVLKEDGSSKNVLMVELLGNLARRDNTMQENAVAFKKCLQLGMSKADVGELAGCSEVTVLNTIAIGELPSFVHKMLDNGQISPTAALNLYKNFGKKAAKGAGVTKVFDEDAQKEMKEFISTLDAEAKLGKAGKRISIKQARSSAPNHVDNLTTKEWDTLVAEANTPEWAALLINAVRGKISWQQARYSAGGFLDFLHKPEIPKKEKVAKPKKEKQPKAETPETGEGVVTQVDTSGIGSLDFLNS